MCRGGVKSKCQFPRCIVLCIGVGRQAVPSVGLFFGFTLLAPQFHLSLAKPSLSCESTLRIFLRFAVLPGQGCLCLLNFLGQVGRLQLQLGVFAAADAVGIGVPVAALPDGAKEGCGHWPVLNTASLLGICERGDGFFHCTQRRRDGCDDHSLASAAEGVLQQPCQLRISVRHSPRAFAECVDDATEGEETLIDVAPLTLLISSSMLSSSQGLTGK
mmetsp:Transcript_33097/g.53261  ORF Transcript_33097/g.53261 Transcript_33097/m.53261 type:complete len:216 (-) Transcript_33097:953-1600(-)